MRCEFPPMPYLLIRHSVQDYTRWKPVFEAQQAFRKQSGEKDGQLFRSAHNPNEIIIIAEWDSIANAHKFTQSESLRDALLQAGVTSKPDIIFLEEAAKV